MFFFFQGDINLLKKKETIFLDTCWGNLLALTAATPPRSPVASVRTFGWPCVLLNSKLICSAGVQTFFSQGGAPRQRSEIPHRMIPIPPKWGAAAWGTPISPKVPMCAGFWRIIPCFSALVPRPSRTAGNHNNIGGMGYQIQFKFHKGLLRQAWGDTMHLHVWVQIVPSLKCGLGDLYLY